MTDLSDTWEGNGPMAFYGKNGKVYTVEELLRETGRREKEDLEVCDITARIDELRQRIGNFPDSTRFYEELFAFVKGSLRRLHDKKRKMEGPLEWLTTGRFGNQYGIEYRWTIALGPFPPGTIQRLKIRPTKRDDKNNYLAIGKGTGRYSNGLLAETYIVGPDGTPILKHRLDIPPSTRRD